MFSPDDPVTHRQLHRIVFERLRAAILDGEFKPGEWLRQKRIARQFGVSQMPVREALKELAADGLVEHVPYRGMRVIRFSPEDVTDLYANRACLEGRAAGAATQNITRAALAELHGLLVQMEQNLPSEKIEEYRRLNRRFHEIIYSASQRGYLVRMLNQLWSAFPTMMLSSFPQTVTQALPERDTKDCEEHEAIVTALESGDAERAEQLMRQHIEQACQEFLSVIGFEE